jgi:O-antigen/teichoic acid export membrane protein
VSEEVGQPSGARRSGAAATSDAFWLILTAYLVQPVSLVFALLLRRQLGPVGMGYVAVTTLVASYASYLSLGAMQAAEREIPIAIARGDEDWALDLEHAGMTVAFAVSIVACAAIFTMGVLRSSSDGLLGAAFMCASVVLFTQQVGIWATVRLRTRLRFPVLGWSNAAGSIASSVLAVVGAVVAGAAGALIGTVIAVIFQAAILVRISRIGGLKLAPRTAFWRLAVLSPAFLASGITATVLLTVDQIAVGSLLGIRSLGLYSAAYLGNAFAVRIPNLIGTVVYPRLQRELGATSDARRVFAMASRTTWALVIAMPLMVALFFVALPALVFLALPSYREAIGPMRLLLLGVFGLAVATPASHYLVTVNRQWGQVGITASILAIMACVYVAAGASGTMSLQVAAGVDVLGYVVYGVVMQVAAHRVAGQPVRQLLPLMPMFAIPMIELLVGAAVADALVPRGNPVGVILHASLQAVLFGATWVVLAFIYLRAHEESRRDLHMVTTLIGRALERLRARLPGQGRPASR